MARLKPDSAFSSVILESDERVNALEIARIEPKTPDDYVGAISQLWDKAQQAFLDIGRLLIRAKETLPHGEYSAAVEARLPFSAITAYQLREATRWALEMDRRQTIPLDRLPKSYSTIYALSTLDPPTLDAAEQDGIVRPDLRRAELIGWKRSRAGERLPNKAALQAKREKLQREREKLDEELRKIEKALREPHLIA